MKKHEPESRNYTTISPSAKVLLLMKGHTDIPFARQAADIISAPETFTPDFNKKDFGFWARVAHFESRYQQVDTLLADVACRNVLELSSGYAFRGLQITREQEIHFIDTDLPEVTNSKIPVTVALELTLPEAKGKLEILPLNVMDEPAFKAIVARFEPGPITIINEGLLMYLDNREKKKLCGIIRAILAERGGYWITADIYLKIRNKNQVITPDDELQQLLDEHRIEDNKFENLEVAEAFFNENGFIVDKEAPVDFSAVGAVKHLLASLPPDKMESLQQTERIQAAWRLRLAD